MSMNISLSETHETESHKNKKYEGKNDLFGYSSIRMDLMNKNKKNCN